MLADADRDPEGKLFLSGRYRKLKRGISQTPFALKSGQQMSETSVEAIICDSVRTVVSGSAFKFIPAGREDMDVRMIGNGRPFALEIRNPNCSSLTAQQIVDLGNATSDTSKGAVATDWRLEKRDVVLKMKSGEEAMQKTYQALVWLSREFTPFDADCLDHLKEVTIMQRTPLRVAHRRANATREKVVHWMKTKTIETNKHYFLLDLCASAGCYIKEFINGDFGRTFPSLYDLLQADDAKCCALDVTGVQLEVDREEDSLAQKRPKPTEDVLSNSV